MGGGAGARPDRCGLAYGGFETLTDKSRTLLVACAPRFSKNGISSHRVTRAALVKSELSDPDGFGIEPELRRFDITAVADKHIEQSLAVVLAQDSIRLAGKVLAATFAFINKNTHVGCSEARSMPHANPGIWRKPETI
jgi:hypothetical protein